FWFLAGAIEGSEAGAGRAAGGAKPIGRNRTDPGGRGRVLVAQPRVVGGLPGLVERVAGPAQRRILRQNKTVAHRTPQIGGEGLGLGQSLIERDQRKAWQKRA